MPTCLEFEAKNIEKAVKKACEDLNISKDKLKYDVISYGSSGIFGLVGVKKARIRVILPEPKSTATITDPSSQTVSEKTDKPHRNNRIHKQAEKKDEPKEEISDNHKTDIFSDSTLELGKNALQRIVDFITTGAKVSVEKTPERILFYVKGGDSGVLIGKRGQTLEAIQYLVEKVVNKQNKQRIRIQIDVEGYLDSRRAKLKSLASRLSEKAKRTGRPVTVGQLNAHDRRIVHISLKDDSDVRTQSMGEGFYRKLVIFPKRTLPQKRGPF